MRAIALAGHETLLAVHRPAGADDGVLRLHLVEPRHAGDGAYGADRRHRLVGPGRRSARSARRSIGFVIGQPFDGTSLPFLVGTAACAAGGFLLIVLTEPKRLFAPIRDRKRRQSRPMPE